MSITHSIDRDDPLHGQRPKKRKKTLKWVKSALHTLLLAIAFVGLGLGGYFGRDTLAKLHLKARSEHDPFSSQITFLNSEKTSPLSVEEEEHLLAQIKGLKKKASISNLAQQIIRHSGYSRVHIFATAPGNLIVSLAKHEPVFVTKLNGSRYVSDRGVVYGEAWATELPRLSGVFNKTFEPRKIMYENQLTLSKSEKDRVITAIKLLKQGKEEGFSFKEIEFKPYRGYFAHMKNPRIVASFGKKPFTQKLRRLQKTLIKLETNNIEAARVDLDYKDKVFIKMRTAKNDQISQSL